MRMRSFLACALAAVFVSGLAGCADHRHPSTTTSPPPDAGATIDASSTDGRRSNAAATPDSSTGPTQNGGAAKNSKNVASQGKGSTRSDGSGSAVESGSRGGGTRRDTVSPTGKAASPQGSFTTTVKSGAVRLGVTRDFGSSSLVDISLGLPRTASSVMDLLEQHARVDTAYGGGFVNSINGLSSGYTDQSGSSAKKTDWFFWVNGALSATGAADELVRPGDDIWWDYHSWSGSMGIPAVVGCYPHPFTTGYGGVHTANRVLYAEGFQSDAVEVAKALGVQGAASVSTGVYSSSGWSNTSLNTIVIAPWSVLSSDTAVQGLVTHGAQTGWYVTFTGNTAIVLHGDGTTASTLRGDVGAILAIGSGAGDRHPTWFITGTTAAGVGEAERLLVNHPEALSHRVGLAVTGNTVLPAPAK